MLNKPVHPTSASELTNLLIADIAKEAIWVANRYCEPTLSLGISTTQWAETFNYHTGFNFLREANVLMLASFLCFVDSIRDPSLPAIGCFREYEANWRTFDYKRNGAMALAGEKLLEAPGLQSRLEISCDSGPKDPSLLVTHFRNNNLYLQALVPKSWLDAVLGVFVVQEFSSLVKARTDLNGIWQVAPACTITDLRSPVWDRLNF